MSKKEKMKIIVLLICMLALMVAFGRILTVFEKYMPEETITSDGFLAESTPQKEPEKAMGSIFLKGEVYDYFHEFESYLLIGTDERESGSTTSYQGGMADFLLLLVLDKTEETYSFLSLNRDTMAEITLLQKDGTGVATAKLQLCTAHWYGGTPEQSCENTVQAVSRLLGNIQIDGYYSLSMTQIPKLNQTVGGVEVELLEDFSQIDSVMKKGKTITLTGSQAYHYVHDRYGIGDEENTSRMKRQRQYMLAFFEKAMNRMNEDNTFVQKINQEMKDVAISNISGRQISGLSRWITRGTKKGFYEFEGKSGIGQALGDGIDHVEFRIRNSSMVNVMTKLYGLKKRGKEE